MTAITADILSTNPPPPLARALEALAAIRTQYGVARAASWARTSTSDIERIAAIGVLLADATLAINLLRDLHEAQRSGNERKVAKVRRRF